MTVTAAAAAAALPWGMHLMGSLPDKHFFTRKGWDNKRATALKSCDDKGSEK